MKIVHYTLLLAFVSLGISFNLKANTPPTISGINCKEAKTGTVYLDACAGEMLCFTVCTDDKDTADLITISGSTGIDGATFTIVNEGDKHETGRFCWTPTDAQASTTPYTFVVTAKDNDNPVNTTQRTFSITVKETPKARYDTLTYDCASQRFTATKSGNVNISQYMWNLSGRVVVRRGGDADTVYHNYKYSGKKPFSLTLIGANGCNQIYEDTFKNPEFVSIKTTDNLTACAGATVQLSAKVSKAFGSFDVSWSTRDEFKNKGGNTSITVGRYDTFVIARVEDAYCTHADTTFIRVNQPVMFDLGRDVSILTGEEHEFRPTIFIDTLDADSVLSYNWYKDDLTNSISNMPFLVANESATYFLIIADSLKCASMDSMVLRVGNTSSIGDKESLINYQSNFKVYPNPAHKNVLVQFDLERAYLEIFDISGQLVLSSRVVNKQTIDVSELSKGSYFMQLKPSAISSDILQRQILLKN